MTVLDATDKNVRSSSRRAQEKCAQAQEKCAQAQEKCARCTEPGREADLDTSEEDTNCLTATTIAGINAGNVGNDSIKTIPPLRHCQHPNNSDRTEETCNLKHVHLCQLLPLPVATSSSHQYIGIVLLRVPDGGKFHGSVLEHDEINEVLKISSSCVWSAP